MSATYTITRALTRKKTVKEQLVKLGSTNTSNIKTYLGNVTVESLDSDPVKRYKTNSQSNFDSFNDLFKELVKITDAIKASNAKTEIKIAGETMTVSEAISLKEVIDVKRNFYKALLEQYESCEQSVLQAEQNIENKARNTVMVMNIDKSDAETYEKLFKVARESAEKENKQITVSGFNIAKLKEDFAKIDEFYEEIDFKLSESNAVTVIEI